jgi:outer membrane protein assembly factor BamB
MKRSLLAQLLLLVQILRGRLSSQTVHDWWKYRRDQTNAGVSLDTGIDSSNVSKLALKWHFGTGGAISASPAIVSGIVYIGSDTGTFYALNGTTGALVWKYKVDPVNPCTPTQCRIGSSPAVWNGIVYFGAENAFVYALNATNGSLL